MKERSAMLIAPDSVIVKKRIRRHLGDIEALMESLKKYGQLSPIIIDRGYELIAGFRRLEAAKRLGWKVILHTRRIDYDYRTSSEIMQE